MSRLTPFLTLVPLASMLALNASLAAPTAPEPPYYHVYTCRRPGGCWAYGEDPEHLGHYAWICFRQSDFLVSTEHYRMEPQSGWICNGQTCKFHKEHGPPGKIAVPK